MSVRERWRQWFLGRHGPESGTIHLHQRRIYILPTRSGILFAVVLVVMYIGAVNYNLGLGHALVFLLVGLGLVGMLHTFRNLAGLGIRAGKCRPVFAGEIAHFEILLDNDRQENRPAIRVETIGRLQKNAGNATDAPRAIDIPANTTAAVVLPVLAERRGRLALDRLQVATAYPLGLFRAWSYPWPRQHCLVYPAPRFCPLPPFSASDRNAGNERLHADNPDDFFGFRRRQPGDSPRHVAWKAYARNTADAPLLVKEFSGSGAAECCLDWALTEQEADVETRLSVLCGWVLQAQREQIEFSLKLPGNNLPPGRGDLHVTRALELLACFGERE